MRRKQVRKAINILIISIEKEIFKNGKASLISKTSGILITSESLHTTRHFACNKSTSDC